MGGTIADPSARFHQSGSPAGLGSSASQSSFATAFLLKPLQPTDRRGQTGWPER